MLKQLCAAMALALMLTSANLEAAPKTAGDVLQQMNTHLRKGDLDMAIFVGNQVKNVDPECKDLNSLSVYTTMGTCYRVKAQRCYARKDIKGASLNFRLAALANRIAAEAAIIRVRKSKVASLPKIRAKLMKEYMAGLRTN